MNNTFKSFNEHQDILVFEQYFPSRVDKTSVFDSNLTISSFPSFLVNSDRFSSYFTYQGMWDLGTINSILENGTLNGYFGGASGGIPLMLNDKNASTTMLISPFANFPLSYQVQREGFLESTIACGLAGTVDHIPAGLF